LREWVCWKRGVYFAKVNPNGTSQTCPACLATVIKGHSCYNSPDSFSITNGRMRVWAFSVRSNANGRMRVSASVSKTVRSIAVREHRCPECNYRTHRDRAAVEMVLYRGLQNIAAQGLWGTETACQVGLSGVYDLDKRRGAGIFKSSRGCARAVLVESGSAGGHPRVSCRPLNFSTTVYLRSCGVGSRTRHQA
jgi:putative transposase